VTEPEEPADDQPLDPVLADVASGSAVAVPRRALRELRGLATGVVVGGLVAIGAFVWFAIEQGRTNHDLHATQRQLAAVVAGEAREEELEQADACVNAHVFVVALQQLVREVAEAGAVVGTDTHLQLTGGDQHDLDEAHALIEQLLPPAIEPILQRYAVEPSCDLEEAQQMLADATDTERGNARGGR
jgi:hypothetical protein